MASKHPRSPTSPHPKSPRRSVNPPMPSAPGESEESKLLPMDEKKVPKSPSQRSVEKSTVSSKAKEMSGQQGGKDKARFKLTLDVTSSTATGEKSPRGNTRAKSFRSPSSPNKSPSSPSKSPVGSPRKTKSPKPVPDATSPVRKVSRHTPGMALPEEARVRKTSTSSREGTKYPGDTPPSCRPGSLILPSSSSSHKEGSVNLTGKSPDRKSPGKSPNRKSPVKTKQNPMVGEFVFDKSIKKTGASDPLSSPTKKKKVPTATLR